MGCLVQNALRSCQVWTLGFQTECGFVFHWVLTLTCRDGLEEVRSGEIHHRQEIRLCHHDQSRDLGMVAKKEKGPQQAVCYRLMMRLGEVDLEGRRDI